MVNCEENLAEESKKLKIESIKLIHSLKERLFPICRSITGNGLRESLKIIAEYVSLTRLEIPTGTKAFDWIVPKEWNIKDAYIKELNGKKIVDFKDNNLHVVGYSIPINKKISKTELLGKIYTLPELPDAIPYRTSYYKEDWGFCIEYNKIKQLKEEEYEICIDSTLENGSMSIGEAYIKGKSEKEILLSTYLCHPSMGNNELSGPIVQLMLHKWLLENQNKLKYSYRLLYLPETIGSITYLSLKGEELKRNLIAGYVLTCVGDNGRFTYKKSRKGDTLADRAALNILNRLEEGYNLYDWFPMGSDERQYCSHGFNLPVGSVMRTMYGKYKEYHTSLDNFDFISAESLYETVEIYKKIIKNLEVNEILEAIHKNGEPKLDKTGIYPTLGGNSHVKFSSKNLMYIWGFADGKTDLIEIAEKLNISAYEIEKEMRILIEKKLIKNI